MSFSVGVLLGAPFFLTGTTYLATINDVVVGAAIIALSLRRGSVQEKYGSWDRYL